MPLNTEEVNLILRVKDMAKNKQRNICIISILSIMCMGMLVIMTCIFLNGKGNNSSQSSQPDNGVSQEDSQTDSKEQDTNTTDADTADVITPPEEMTFSYGRHQACGVKGNVYCVLLTDFDPSSDWQQRIRKTISHYIESELGGGSTSDYLIYFFQNEECYQQKIASKATEMCNVPDGEVAASSWGKIYYEYGEE